MDEERRGYRFGKVDWRHGYIFVAIGPQRSHLEFILTLPSFSWGWYGGPDWYHRWRWRQLDRRKARAARKIRMQAPGSSGRSGPA